MDASLLTTLRQLFPTASLTHVSQDPPHPSVTLGAVLDVAIRGRAIVVVFEQGVELRFFPDLPSWRVLEAHLRTGELTFDDPERGMRRLAEILGTHREHLDA